MTRSALAIRPEDLPRALRPVARRARKLLLPRVGEVVGRKPVVQRQFHGAVTWTNYVDAFFVRSRDLDEEMNRIHAMTQPLNAVDREICQYCEELAHRTPVLADLNLISILVGWKQTHQRRNFQHCVE